MNGKRGRHPNAVMIRAVAAVTTLTCHPSIGFATGLSDLTPSDVNVRQDAKRLVQRCSQSGGACTTNDDCPEGEACCQNCEVAWSYRFERSLTDNKLLIKVKIFLDKQAGVTDALLTPKKAAWKGAIEGAWSGRAELNCTKGDPGNETVKPIPVNIQVEFVATAAAAHYTVQVFSSLPRRSMTRWSLNMPDNTAVHEFGHMIGAFDEYAGGGGFRAPSDIDKTTKNKCPIETPTDSNSVMGNINGSPMASHYACVQSAMEAEFSECSFETKIIGGLGATVLGVQIPVEGDYDPAVFEFTCPLTVQTPCCTLPDGTVIDGLSEQACLDNAGKWDPEVCVPTVSEWGLIALTLVLLTAGTIVMRHRHVIAIGVVALLATLSVPVRTLGEPAPLPARMQPVGVDSGVLANPANRAQVFIAAGPCHGPPLRGPRCYESVKKMKSKRATVQFGGQSPPCDLLEDGDENRRLSPVSVSRDFVEFQGAFGCP